MGDIIVSTFCQQSVNYGLNRKKDKTGMERNDTRVLLQSEKCTSLYSEKSIKLRDILKESGANLSDFIKKKLLF